MVLMLDGVVAINWSNNTTRPVQYIMGDYEAPMHAAIVIGSLSHRIRNYVLFTYPLLAPDN